MFTRKHMLKILRIALAQVKAVAPLKTHILFVSSKTFTEKVNNNIMNSIEIQHKMDAILMNFK